MDETCPFCKYELLAGAEICASCGSYEERPDGGGALLFIIGGLISMVIGIKLSESDALLWGLMVAVLGAAFFAISIKRKPFWVRGY
ncbi:hypothetical protein [Oceanisphaera sp. IT1-181]|uniref:hypothetical protein n=1 Tax=Oceanisphaera sp. IT1-181 TaxID=3081199 RepID=UPI0029C9E245|nr:hypothetical protein [Oceanisphaera sp. IT1-181]